MGEINSIFAKRSEANKNNSDLQTRRINRSGSKDSSVDRILYLQRTIGNQAVSRLIRSKALQAKLRIGQPGDVYEQEADRVADAVMRMPEPEMQRQVDEEEEEEILQTKPLVDQITPLVQRQVEEEEEEEMLQAKSSEDATSEVSYGLESQINVIKGVGRPLGESERAYFEPRFGADFSKVRIHTNTQAAKTAQALNAQAFTLGYDIVFGRGHYVPEETEGRRLLAHELTHTIQQGSVTEKQKPLSTNPEITSHVQAVLHNHDKKNIDLATRAAFQREQSEQNERENSSTMKIRPSIIGETKNYTSIQRRILIGTDFNQHPMTSAERDSVFVAGYCDPLIIQADSEAASRILEDMERSHDDLIFQDLDELRAEVAGRIQSGQGVLPREMTEEVGINWLDENYITYTVPPHGAVRFSNAITVDFSQVVSGFNLHDGRERVSNIHPVTPRLAVALVRLIRHLYSEGVTTLHHVGVSVGTHAEIGYAIDIRGFSFNDGTTILLPPAWNDSTTRVPTGETAQQYMRRIGQWMADNVFGQVLGPGVPRHDNHFHAQVPFGRRYRGLITGTR